MTELIYPKSNLKILGQIFKYERLKKGYSLRGIARSENITPTLISEIETGKIYPNLETLVSLFKQVDINLNIDIEYLKDMFEQIELYNEAMYYSHREMMKETYKKIIRQKDKLLYSLIFVDFKLAEISYNSSYEGDYSLDELNKLEPFYSYFCDGQKQKFNLVKGVNLFKIGQFDEGVKYLETNLNIYANQKAHAITLSYLAISYERQYRIHNTILQANRASKLHGEHANLKRKLAADLVLVKNLTEAGRFHEANSTLNNLELTIQFDDIDTKPFFNRLRFLRSYIFYRQGYYEDALKELELYEVNDNYFHLYKANILNRLGQVDEAVSVLNESLKLEAIKNHYLFFRMNRLFMYYIKKDFTPKDYEKCYSEIMEKPQEIYEMNLFRMVQIMGLEYYEYHSEFDKALKIAKNYMISSRFL